MDIEIKKLSKDLLGDYLHFFDNLVFDEHPDWQNCYCYSYHFTGTAEEWEIKGRNREKVIEYINCGKMCGYLAYNDGLPIGWVNANDRNNYERLTLLDEIQDGNLYKVCSVVCFVIKSDFRRKGVATKLLERVCADYKADGYSSVEAYPDSKAVSNEDNFNGPLSLYIKNGFHIFKEFKDYKIVRREL